MNHSELHVPTVPGQVAGTHLLKVWGRPPSKVGEMQHIGEIGGAWGDRRVWRGVVGEVWRGVAGEVLPESVIVWRSYLDCP